MFALGLTGGTLYFLTENTAMNYTTTTNTSLIVSLSPLVAALLISLFYKSLRLNRAQSIGMVMAAVGVVIVVLNGHFVLHLSPLGDSLAFSAALCWGFYSLLMIPANMRYDTVFVTRKVFFYGLLAMIPYYLLKPDEAIIFSVEEVRTRYRHQLRLFQSRHHHPLCVGRSLRTDHHLFHPWHHTDPCRSVPHRKETLIWMRHHRRAFGPFCRFWG